MTENNTSAQKLGILQMVICALLWSLGGLLIKFVQMNPFVIAGARSLLAAIPVSVYMLVKKQKFILSQKTALAGIFLCALFLLFVSANKLTTAANAIVLQYTGPVYIILFSAAFEHKKPSAVDTVTVIAILLGIAVFFFDGLGGGKTIGNLLALASGVALGALFYTVGNTAGEEKMSGILLGQIFCALIGLPCLLFTENTFELRGIAALTVLGIFQIGIPYILYALASNRCSAIHCCILGMIEPIMNPILVAVFNGEVPSPLAIAAGVFVIAVITAYSVWDLKHPKEA